MKIEIYTDGSCIGNPGPGGWAAIILQDGARLAEVKGKDPDTTNNRMEMTAVIKALEYLHQNSLTNHDITLYSDSNLIIKTINDNWKRKKNTDLWAQIEKNRAWLNITWTWVKAHAKNQLNNEVDKLAFGEAKKI